MLEDALHLGPEAMPGSPAGIPTGREREWQEFTSRAKGRYKLVDSFPPGIQSVLFGRIIRPRLTEAGDCVLAVEGVTREPGFVYPDGEPGRYRAAFPISNGTKVVIEEKRNGFHLWASILHLLKPKR